MRYHLIYNEGRYAEWGWPRGWFCWVAGCVIAARTAITRVTWDPNGGLAFGRKAKAQRYLTSWRKVMFPVDA